MSTQNAVISQLASDFAKFQTDFTTFSAAVRAFITSAQAGTTGTQLSPTDAATLQEIDTALDGLDSTIGAFNVPAPPAPPAG